MGWPRPQRSKPDFRLTVQGPRDSARRPHPITIDGVGRAHAVVTQNTSTIWRYHLEVGVKPAAAEGAFLITTPTV